MLYSQVRTKSGILADSWWLGWLSSEGTRSERPRVTRDVTTRSFGLVVSLVGGFPFGPVQFGLITCERWDLC